MKNWIFSSGTKNKVELLTYLTYHVQKLFIENFTRDLFSFFMKKFVNIKM